MKVLITGSSGWLGRFLIPLLEEAGHDPVGLDTVKSEWTDVIASVSDSKAIADLFDRSSFEGVIHAAALHKPDIARYPQQTFVDVNVTGTLNLLEAAVRNEVSSFVFTSTTSLMISHAVRSGSSGEAIWMDEDFSPILPRNIYGVTKLAAEGLCRQHHLEHGLPCIILRTARFFPEEDDTLDELTGPNLKANELLNRRATVRDMARAHIAALEQAADIGFGLYIVSAPTPFSKEHSQRLKRDPISIISELFSEASDLYEAEGWKLPETIGRVYDGSRICRELGFRYETTFGTVLTALSEGRQSPVEHKPDYVSPLWQKA